ncbi:MAG: sulfotransferase [Candidatus Omnitrophica bacterium]|nr:sulfotransferase [Candidatus Omnitrophota bacterium]
MNFIKKLDRYIAIRLQLLLPLKDLKQRPPLLFLGGMTRSGNHLLHSLLDGHKSISSIPDEDYFLRTNVSSILNQFLLFYYLRFGTTEQKIDFFLKQNKRNNWQRISNESIRGHHEVDFDIIDYKKLNISLRNLAGKQHKNICCVYQDYIDCVIGAVPAVNNLSDNNNNCWRLYFTANADFLVRPIMSWDKGNKVIVPVRDPLQRFASHKEWEKSDFICSQRNLSAWKAVHRSYSLFKKRYNSRILYVDYTKLIDNTENAMRRISKFLGTEYDSILSYPTVLGKPISGNTSFSKDPDKIGRVYKDSLHRYKDILSRKEREIIKAELEPLYLEFLNENCQTNG